MNASYDQLDNLLAIQQLDLAIMKGKKSRVELPQRIEVMRLRKKRDEIQGKLDQVCELQKKADAEMMVVQDEDRMLAEKQQRAQELIDASGSDFRKVESHSREMAGAAKRREELEGKKADIQAQLDKVLSVKSQLEDVISASQSEEQRLRAAFESEDQAIADQIREWADQRAKLAADVPDELMDLYAKTAAKVGGVALGKLEEDGTCGVCRTAIEGGRLIELKASAPLGVCPNCKRLLVVE